MNNDVVIVLLCLSMSAASLLWSLQSLLMLPNMADLNLTVFNTAGLEFQFWCLGKVLGKGS